MAIPQSIIDAFNSEMDQFLADPMCVTATLYMPPRKIACSCGIDSIGNKPGNANFSGRPQPFGALGNCSMCAGTGFRQEEVTEDICVRPYWNPQEWLTTNPNNAFNRENRNKIIVSNNTKVQIKTFMYNLPKILNATHLVFTHTGLVEYVNFRFMLEGEPVPLGFTHSRYCVSYWVRSV